MQDNKTQSDTTFSLNATSFRVPGRTLLRNFAD
jgi:iron complex transport system ATP-binding protein